MHESKPRTARRRNVWPSVVMTLIGAMLAPIAIAHSVSLWAEVLDDGETVRVEVYATDGQRLPDLPIEITAADGTLRASGQTDEEGRFEMHREQAEDLTIRVQRDDHHRAVVVLAADGSLREPE